MLPHISIILHQFHAKQQIQSKVRVFIVNPALPAQYSQYFASMFENSEGFEFTSVNQLTGRCEDLRLLCPPLIDYNQQNSLSTAKQIFQSHGFLVVKNFMPELALQPFIKRLHGDLQQLGYIASDGRLLGKESMCLSGYAPLTDCLQYQKITQTIADSKLFGQLFGQTQCQPLVTKYLTGLGPRKEVPLHCDYYRLKAHAQPVFTTWLPLSQLDLGSGTLVAGKKYQQYQLENQINGREIPQAFLQGLESAVLYYCRLRPGDLVLLDSNVVYGTTRRNDLAVVSLHSDIKWIANKPVFQFSVQ